ncbi:MAG TPA: DUF2917 domain-containing protein [Deltaproteobacteria bacterium]|nr:DUF2917 domain-containing protein [Deltaproteobacteria bacterium]HON61414.1 DUF2917 domain-containing protein [Deltaproteobacteria bacterium]
MNYISRAGSERRESEEIRIRKGCVVEVPHARQGIRVMCASGMIWLTRENDPADHVMGEHSSLSISGPGLIIMEALEDSVIRVVHGRMPSLAGEDMRNCHSFGVFPRTSR